MTAFEQASGALNRWFAGSLRSDTMLSVIRVQCSPSIGSRWSSVEPQFSVYWTLRLNCLSPGSAVLHFNGPFSQINLLVPPYPHFNGHLFSIKDCWPFLIAVCHEEIAFENLKLIYCWFSCKINSICKNLFLNVPIGRVVMLEMRW